MAVVVVLILVAALALGTLGGSDADDAGPVPSGTGPDGPPGPSGSEPDGNRGEDDPSLPGLDPEGDPEALARPLDEVVPEIIAFVEEERGHRFTTTPVVQGLSEEAFLDRLHQEADDPEASDPGDEIRLRATGLLPPGTDLDDAVSDLLDDGVKGFYAPETGELVVRGDVITPYVQTVIAHELTHALDDQVFDLSRSEGLEDRPDESAFAFQALTEGSARAVEVAFTEEALDADEQAAVEIEKLGGGSGGGGSAPSFDPDLLPLTLLMLVPYGNGQRLVDALRERGTAALDGAFLDPPTTSEQVLDPEVYGAREPAGAVDPPAADGPEADRGAFGAVDLRLLELVANPVAVLRRMDPQLLLDGVAALDPVDGFGGGQYVTWQADDEACIRVNLTGDDGAGTAVITELVEGWARTIGAEVTSPGPNGITFTSCR